MRTHLVTFALLVGTFFAALDMNVVGTSLPTIISRLGDLELYGWVFSAYMLTSTTTLPLYGRLSDVYGRKPMYLIAAALFIVGSALCGAAQSMIALILFRAIQGLGAGGILPITIILFGDLYPAEKRAFVQALFSTVWGISSVLGPLIGGFVVTHFSWRWVFWLNLPLGMTAAAVFARALREDRPPAARGAKESLDLPGVIVVTAGLFCLLLGLQRTQSAERSLLTFGLLAGAAALIGVFALLERRAPNPMLPRDLLRNRAVLVTSGFGLFLGAFFFSLVTFVPLYAQGVLHSTPTQAGMALVPMSILWTLTTFAVGYVCRRLGYRPVVIAGGLFCLFGGATLPFLSSSSSLLALYAAIAAVGPGMSLLITPTTIAVQDSVGWERRGATTTLVQFSRTIGGMIAVTVLSVVVTARFVQEAPRTAVAVVSSPSELLDPERWASLPAEVLSGARGALDGAIQLAFWTMAGLALLTLIIALAFPRLEMRSAD